MSSFSCPHYDGGRQVCWRLKHPCVPGRAGCAPQRTSRFLFSPEERLQREREDADARSPDSDRGAQGAPGSTSTPPPA